MSQRKVYVKWFEIDYDEMMKIDVSCAKLRLQLQVNNVFFSRIIARHWIFVSAHTHTHTE